MRFLSMIRLIQGTPVNANIFTVTFGCLHFESVSILVCAASCFLAGWYVQMLTNPGVGILWRTKATNVINEMVGEMVLQCAKTSTFGPWERAKELVQEQWDESPNLPDR